MSACFYRRVGEGSARGARRGAVRAIVVCLLQRYGARVNAIDTILTHVHGHHSRARRSDSTGCMAEMGRQCRSPLWGSGLFALAITIREKE